MNIAIKGAKNYTLTIGSFETANSVNIHISVLKVIQLFTKLVSVGAFFGSIVVQEKQNAQIWSILSQDPFLAVGQCGNIAVVLLVLIAAGVRRIWAGTGAGSTVVEENRRPEEIIEESEKGKAWSRGKNSLLDDDAKNDYWRDGEDEDVETGKEDWDWRIGYAS